MKYDLRGVCGSFDLRGEYVIGVPFGTGHINDTFAVTFDQSGTRVRYIVQRVNTNVFKQPEQLMENFERVTSHIREKIRLERAGNPATRHRTLELVPAKDGRPFVRDGEGNFSAVTALSKMRAPTTSSRRRSRRSRRLRRSGVSRTILPISRGG